MFCLERQTTLNVTLHLMISDGQKIIELDFPTAGGGWRWSTVEFF